MNEIILLPHNEEGYQNLISALEDHQMVSLIRATGTGKSFILLKFCGNIEIKEYYILHLHIQ